MTPLFRLWTKLRQRRRRPGFHSRFGGLWTDRLDAARRLGVRRAGGEVSADDERALRHWIDEGYWTVPGAIAPERIDALCRAIDALWDSPPGHLVVEIAGEVVPYRQDLRARHCKLVDLYALSANALDTALSEPIQRFLRLVFDAPPLLFQSLSFERGSEQPAHQDTAYVVVTPPLELAAAWIALEDVQPGSGELFYYPRSHRMREFLFRGGVRNFNRERDGEERQRRYHEWLLEQAEATGLVRQIFRPRKGDVFFWSADLVHGGSPIADRTLTRKSYVCHYCPEHARPYYLSYLRAQRLHPHASGARWVSSHYRAQPADASARAPH